MSEHIQVVAVDNQLVAVDTLVEVVDNLAVVVDNLAVVVDNHRIDLEVHYFLQEADSRTLGAVPCLKCEINDCDSPGKQCNSLRVPRESRVHAFPL